MVEVKQINGIIEGVTKLPKYWQVIVEKRKFNTKSETLGKELLSKTGQNIELKYTESTFNLPNGDPVTMKWIMEADDSLKVSDEEVCETETHYEKESNIKSYTNETFNPEGKKIIIPLDREKGYSFGMAMNGAIILTAQDHNVKDMIGEMNAIDTRFEGLFKLIEEKRKKHLR